MKTEAEKALNNSTFSVFHHQDTHMIQQQPDIYLILPVAADKLGKILLVVLDIPIQTEFQDGFGLPSHIPAYSDSVPIVLPCGLPLTSHAINFFLLFELY